MDKSIWPLWVLIWLIVMLPLTILARPEKHEEWRYPKYVSNHAELMQFIGTKDTHFRIHTESAEFIQGGFYSLSYGSPYEEIIHCKVVTKEIMAECTRGMKIDFNGLTIYISQSTSSLAYMHSPIRNNIIKPVMLH